MDSDFFVSEEMNRAAAIAQSLAGWEMTRQEESPFRFQVWAIPKDIHCANLPLTEGDTESEDQQNLLSMKKAIADALLSKGQQAEILFAAILLGRSPK